MNCHNICSGYVIKSEINVWMSLMSQWVMSQKTFKILFNFGIKNFEFSVFKERGNDIWYK